MGGGGGGAPAVTNRSLSNKLLGRALSAVLCCRVGWAAPRLLPSLLTGLLSLLSCASPLPCRRCEECFVSMHYDQQASCGAGLGMRPATSALPTGTAAPRCPGALHLHQALPRSCPCTAHAIVLLLYCCTAGGCHPHRLPRLPIHMRVPAWRHPQGRGGGGAGGLASLDLQRGAAPQIPAWQAAVPTQTNPISCSCSFPCTLCCFCCCLACSASHCFILIHCSVHLCSLASFN